MTWQWLMTYYFLLIFIALLAVAMSNTHLISWISSLSHSHCVCDLRAKWCKYNSRYDDETKQFKWMKSKKIQCVCVCVSRFDCVCNYSDDAPMKLSNGLKRKPKPREQPPTALISLSAWRMRFKIIERLRPKSSRTEKKTTRRNLNYSRREAGKNYKINSDRVECGSIHAATNCLYARA